MRGLGIRARLALLLGLLLALMAVAAGVALAQLRGVTLAVQSVYDDRVLPLLQLRAVSQAYVIGLPRIAREVNDGEVSAAQALAQLEQLERNAREQWARYKVTYLVPREQELIARAEPLLAQAEARLTAYTNQLSQGMRPSGADLTPQGLHAATRSLGQVLDELVQVQADEAATAATSSQAAYRVAAWSLLALGVLACSCGVGLAWMVVLRYARERREGEAYAERLARCHAALSRTNQMIVRVRDEALLYEEICRICVETGLARMAVVLVQDSGDQYRLAGAAGPVREVFEGEPLKLQPAGVADGPIPVALRENRIDICNDYLQAERVARHHLRARQHGIRALAAFPIRRAGKAVGALALFVGEVGFFDDARVALLEEMAGDLSFALDNIDRDAAHLLAEREVEAGYERVQRMFNAMPVAILLLSRRTGVVVLANAAAADRYGMSIETMVGRAVQDMSIALPTEVRRRFYAELDAQRSVRNFEVRVHTERGEELDLLTNAELIDYMGEPCVLTVSLDITERKRREAAERARQDAEASSRAKTDFLSRMSHELRTPLNAVLGFSQLLQSDAQQPLSERQRAQVEAIRQAGWHLLALVNDVLDVSRIESGHLRVDLKAVDLLALLDEVMELLQSQAERAGVMLQRADGEGPATVKADPVRLRQVLVNVLSNAIKYNRPGGVVSVEIERSGPSVGMTVADTGIGMTRSQLDRLFEPFNRLGREHSDIEGTGIGLVLTRQLLTLMQGTLEVESEAGSGTTVHVTLQKSNEAPATPQGSKPGAGVPEHVDQPEGLVLYIEDNPINLLLVEQLLLSWPGVRLVQAETAAKGLELARALQPHLVLLDMRLPDMSGPEVLTALRKDERTRGLRVVALSASAMPEEVAEARECGAYDYWTKPLDFDRFMADLRRLLAGSTVNSV